MTIARRRRLVAVGVTAGFVGLLGGTAASALYYRTDAYRRYVEARLTDFFGLPTEVGRVEPHTFHSRVFRDVAIWLPDRRDRIFLCPEATWNESGSGPRTNVDLDLAGGMLSIGSERWQPDDYGRVLRAVFTKHLADLNLRQVRFDGIKLVWPRADMRLTAEGVTGQLTFDEQDRGEASLIAQSLNGQPVAEPIHIHARVLPKEEEFLPEVTLKVPPMPIAALQLDRMLRTALRSGTFGGEVTYRQQSGAEVMHVVGQADGLALRELTELSSLGPVDGRVSVRIEEATIAGRELRSIRFRGRLEGLDLMPLARRAGYPGVTGRAEVTIHQAVIEGRRMHEFIAAGRVDGVPLKPITQRLGQGTVDGVLGLRLNGLRIVDDRIVSLDADVDVRPPAGREGTIERALLLGAFREALGFTLPEQILPERIEFVRMAAKLLVNEGRLRVLGGIDTRRDTIIVLRILGQPIPIPAPAETYSIESMLEAIQKKAHDVDVETLRRWWAPQPATGPATHD